jgi:hypothetical protein
MKNETNWIIFLFTCKEIYITAIIVIEISEFKSLFKSDTGVTER